EVLVEIRVEDALVHEVKSRAYVEKHPPQIVQSQRRENGGVTLHRVFDRLAIGADRVLTAGEHLGDDGEPIARRGLGKDRTPATLLELEVTFFRNGHRGWLGPIILRHGFLRGVVSES